MVRNRAVKEKSWLPGCLFGVLAQRDFPRPGLPSAAEESDTFGEDLRIGLEAGLVSPVGSGRGFCPSVIKMLIYEYRCTFLTKHRSRHSMTSQTNRQGRSEMKATLMSHIAFCVRDIDKSLAFYRDVLGMEVVFDQVQDTTSGSLPNVYKMVVKPAGRCT